MSQKWRTGCDQTLETSGTGLLNTLINKLLFYLNVFGYYYGRLGTNGEKRFARFDTYN